MSTTPSPAPPPDADLPASTASILASSTTGWSPLRITKRSPGSPPKPSVPSNPSANLPRRGSSSFAHLRQHSLVSNSPFKGPSPNAGLGITLPSPNMRPASQPPPSRIPVVLPSVSEIENNPPPGHQQPARVLSGSKRRPRHSKGLQELGRQERVSRSPFLEGGARESEEEGISSSGSAGSLNSVLCKEKKQNVKEVEVEKAPSVPSKSPEPMVVVPAPPVSTITTLPTTGPIASPAPAPAALTEPSPTRPSHVPSLNPSPRRPALTSHRLHGPRRVSSNPSRNGTTKRRRRKTVTFDERCDVLEFERDEAELELELDGEEAVDEEWESGEGEEVEGEWDTEGEEADEGEMETSMQLTTDRLVVVNATPADAASSPALDSLVSSLVASPPLATHIPSPDAGDLLDRAMGQTSMHVTSIQEEQLASGDGSMERMDQEVEAILRSAHVEGTPAIAAGTVLTTTTTTTTTTSTTIEPMTPVAEEPEAEAEVEHHSLIHASFASSHTSVSLASFGITSDGDPNEGSFRIDHAIETASLSTVEADGDGEGNVSSSSVLAHPHAYLQTEREDDSLDLSREIASWSPANMGGAVEESTPTHRRDVADEMREEEGEGGVPWGRTHHAERRRWARESGGERNVSGSVVDVLDSPSRHEKDVGVEELVFDVEEKGDDVGDGGLAPSLPDLAKHSPFVLPTPRTPPLHTSAANHPTTNVAHTHAPSPRITREGVRARLARAARSRPVSTSASSPITGPDSPQPIEKPTPQVDVSLVLHPASPAKGPGAGAGVDKDKALPAPPEGSKGSLFGLGEGKSALDRLVEGVRGDVAGASSGEKEAKAHRRVPVPSAGMERANSIRERKEAILAKRRERRRAERSEESEEEGDGGAESDDEGKRLKVPIRPKKRRSLSAGDAEDMKAHHQQNEVPVQLDDALVAHADGAFADAVEREVRKLHEPGRSYQIREHQVKVYASPRDNKVSHVAQAGDVDSGRAWRTVRRPSDMNEYARQIREFRAMEKPGKALGKVFVRVLGIKGITVPLPLQPTFFTLTLNNGIHAVTTPEIKLARDSAIEQEFELIEHAKLEFTLTLKVRKDAHIIAQLRPPAPPVVRAPSPKPIVVATPHKSGGFRSLFTSPKKAARQAAARPAAPLRTQSDVPAPAPPVQQEDNLARYMAADGTLGSAVVAFKDIARRCDTRLFETSYPLMSRSSDAGKLQAGSVAVTAQRAVGEIILQMFRLPALPGVHSDQLPQSLEDCHRGLRHVAWHKAVYHEGILTQNGGDCSTWRRRRFRVVGANMVAFSDVTKKISATIELQKAASIEDDQDPVPPQPSLSGSPKMTRSRSTDDNLYTSVQRSFRISFVSGEEIAFFADSDEEKAKWLEVLKALIARIPPHPLWAELLWQRQEELVKQSAAFSSTPSATKEQSASKEHSATKGQPIRRR